MLQEEELTCSMTWALLLNYKKFRFPKWFIGWERGEQGKSIKIRLDKKRGQMRHHLLCQVRKFSCNEK